MSLEHSFISYRYNEFYYAEKYKVYTLVESFHRKKQEQSFRFKIAKANLRNGSVRRDLTLDREYRELFGERARGEERIVRQQRTNNRPRCGDTHT